MSYQVLARKWRPQSFLELVGQEHVAVTLINAMKTGRMPHALLFTGARGVGKTSTARILAKSLRCPHAVDFVPCQQCNDCLEITAGHSSDVIEIDGASNNSVENIRELRESVGYMPFRGQYKIYIIDEVHMLSGSAFNALLKTLEEPPSHVIFIFATTEVQKIPVTILSRCQRFDLKRIPARKIVERLKAIVDQEGLTAEPQALWLIARESEGSMRDSQSLLDQVITFSQGPITHTRVTEILGLTDRTLLAKTLQTLIKHDASTCLEIVKHVYDLGYDAKEFGQDLLEYLRHFMVVKTLSEQGSSVGDETSFLDLPQEEIDELKKASSEMSTEDIHLLFDMALKGMTDVVRAQDSRIVLEMLLLRMSQAPRWLDVAEYVAQTSRGGSPPTEQLSQKSPPAPDIMKIQQKHQSAPLEVKPVISQRPTVTAEEPVSPAAQSPLTWEKLVESVRKERPILGTYLEHARVDFISDTNIKMHYHPDDAFYHNHMIQKETLQQLQNILEKNFGRSLQFEIQLGQQQSNQPPILSLHDERTQKQADHDKNLRDKVEAHPFVKELQNTFQGRITSIKELT